MAVKERPPVPWGTEGKVTGEETSPFYPSRLSAAVGRPTFFSKFHSALIQVMRRGRDVAKLGGDRWPDLWTDQSGPFPFGPAALPGICLAKHPGGVVAPKLGWPQVAKRHFGALVPGLARQLHQPAAQAVVGIARRNRRGSG